jgi:hypothetical protein
MPQARVRSNWAGRSSANTERYRTKASNEGNDDQPRDLWDGMLMTSRSQGNAHMEPDLAFYFSTDQNIGSRRSLLSFYYSHTIRKNIVFLKTHIRDRYMPF